MKGRKTGGRQAGTPNKATSGLRIQVEAEAGAPLPVLLARIGREAMATDLSLAVMALSKAAAYVYPRPQELPYQEPLPRMVIIDDIDPAPPERNEDGSLNVVIRLPTQHRQDDATG